MPTPRNTKSKSQSITDPAKPKRKVRTKDRGRGAESVRPSAEMDIAAWQCDPEEELVLMFLSDFQAFEKALLRAGYTRAGRIAGSVHPDWSRFARQIQSRFDPESSPVLQGSVAYMLGDDANLELRSERIENAHLWENPDPNNDTVWLAELVQQTGRKIIQGYNFPGQADVDVTMVSAAVFIMQEWLRLEPQVAGLMRSGL